MGSVTERCGEVWVEGGVGSVTERCGEVGWGEGWGVLPATERCGEVWVEGGVGSAPCYREMWGGLGGGRGGECSLLQRDVGRFGWREGWGVLPATERCGEVWVEGGVGSAPCYRVMWGGLGGG